MSKLDLVVPDLGGFDEVPIIDVLVKVGDSVEVDTPLVTLETDKASMDVPATGAGKIVEVTVKRGDKVSKGSVIARVEAAGAAAASTAAKAGAREAARPESSGDTVRMPTAPAAKTAAPPAAEAKAPAAGAAASATKAQPVTPVEVEGADRKTQVLVLGAGPGGYTAAFRAADLGLQVTLIERWESLGGVCLNVGCIPSKALLHAAKVIDEASSMAAHGVTFGKPTIDLDKLRNWKTSVVKKLTGGLKMLAKQRKVDVVTGYGKFVSPNLVEVKGNDGKVERIAFDQPIIAAGSEPVKLPGFPDDPRIIDSTGALELPKDVKRLLVIGGGIIGLEMATVYEVAGREGERRRADAGPHAGRRSRSREAAGEAAARSLRSDLRRHQGGEGRSAEGRHQGHVRRREGARAAGVRPRARRRGRTPNGKLIGAEAAGVTVTDRGFIPADKQLRTNVPHIFAIGDIIGQPMLARKAMHEAKVAAEVAAGEKRSFDVRAIPSVATPIRKWPGPVSPRPKRRRRTFRARRARSVGRERSLALAGA